MNTGLWFRKPYESVVGAHQRFMIANRGASFKQMKAQFAKPPDQQRREAWWVDAAQDYERQACHALGVQYSLPSKLSTNALVRNCWRCAEHGYHTTAFQWPWVKQCPLHGEYLSYSCPDCGQPWPQVNQLTQRQCRLCGIRKSYDQLANLKSYEARPFQQAFAPLYASIDRCLGLPPLPLENSFLFRHTACLHRGVTVEQSCFASVFADLIPELSEVFEMCGAPTYPTINKEYVLSAKPAPQKLLGSSELKVKTSDRIDRVRRRIEDHIEKQFEHDDGCYSCDLPRLNGEQKTYEVALNLWSAIQDEPWGCYQRPHYRHRYRFEPSSYIGLPRIPVVMDSIAFSNNEVQQGLPVTLALDVYEWDLMACYSAILTYFLVYEMSEGAVMQTMISRLPEEAHPHSWYNAALSVFQMDEQTLRVVTPTCLLNNSFEHAMYAKLS